jgi:hypothetical protein
MLSAISSAWLQLHASWLAIMAGQCVAMQLACAICNHYSALNIWPGCSCGIAAMACGWLWLCAAAAGLWS